MKLKNAVFAMKEALMEQPVQASNEDFIEELEKKNNLAPGKLAYYFDHLMLQESRHEQLNMSSDSKKINRKWTKEEIAFMFQYIKDRQFEGALNITDILEEVAQLLNRGYQSVNYKFYSIVKSKEKNNQPENQNQQGYTFTTIPENEVPVLSTELIRDYTPTPIASVVPAQADDDLLDILSGLITNIQQLPGIQLNELLRSLYLLTNMALANQNVAQKLEEMKKETNQEKETLKEKLKKQEQQLLEEKRRSNQLQQEIANLAGEIKAFNQLGDAAKIQNLKSYNQRLTNIIDGRQVEIKYGS